MVKILQFFQALQFRGNWKLVLCLLLVFLLLMRLGIWQISRVEHKKYLHELMTTRFLSKPVALNSLPITPLGKKWYSSTKMQQQVKSELEWINVSLMGRYINEKSLLIKGRFYQGQLGYEVITPFLLTRSDTIVLISRGWIAAEKSVDAIGKTLPKIHLVPGDLSIQGNIHVPMVPTYFLSETLSEVDDLVELHYLDLNAVDSLFEKPLLSFVVRLKDDEHGVLKRHWRATDLDLGNHISYALQWFAMSFIVLIILILKSTNLVDIVKTRRSKD